MFTLWSEFLQLDCDSKSKIPGFTSDVYLDSFQITLQGAACGLIVLLAYHQFIPIYKIEKILLRGFLLIKDLWSIVPVNSCLYHVYTVCCLLITLTCSPKAELRRAQLNGIGWMHALAIKRRIMNLKGRQTFITELNPLFSRGTRCSYPQLLYKTNRSYFVSDWRRSKPTWDVRRRRD